MAAAVGNEEYEKAAELRDKKRQLQQLKEKKQEWEQEQHLDKAEITPEDIAHIVSSWTGIPVARLAQEESERLLNLETELHRRVIGQDEAVTAVAKAVRRPGRLGIPNAP